MPPADKKYLRLKSALPLLLILGVPLVLTLILWGVFGDLPESDPNFFARRYPASLPLQQELHYMRSAGKIQVQDERLLEKSVKRTARLLEIPPAILWCLFFQESRLNHRLGIDGNSTSHGLGQFTHFGFQEINQHLGKYDRRNLRLLVRLLGRDVRPIVADKDTDNPSSYYHIPTAVATSGIFLKNRFTQLGGILHRQGIPYDIQILWLYAIMAYNKGTRSVLTYWNELRDKGGTTLVKRFVQDKTTFFNSLKNPHQYEKSFLRIWPAHKAYRYARELAIHMRNISGCAVNRPSEISRQIAGDEGK